MSALMTQLLALAERIGVEAKDLRHAIEGKGAMIGEVKLLAFAAVPDGWIICNGATLPQTAYPALFDVIGTTFGGGAGTYVLPNFKTALPRQAGDGLVIGATSSTGSTVNLDLSFTLTQANMPSHTHAATMHVSTNDAGSPAPLTNGYLAAGATDGTSTPFIYVEDPGALSALGADTIAVANTGGGAPVSTNAQVTLPAAMPPVVGVNYVIYAGSPA